MEVGDWDGTALRRVDLWAAGQWLTCDDNVAFVPQFRSSAVPQFRREVAETAAWLRAGGGVPVPLAGLSPAAAHRRLMAGAGDEEEDDRLRRRFRLFDRWGPATDNIEAYLFRDGERLEVTWQFWREEDLLRHPEHAGTVFTVEVGAAELAGLLEDLAAVLGCDGEPLAGA